MTRLNPALRLRLMQVILLSAIAVLGIRVATMQWFNPVVPPEYGDGLAPRLLTVEPARGLILDRNGEVLARNTPSYQVSLVPGELPAEPDDRRAAFLRLETLSGIPFQTLEQAASTHLALVDPYQPITVKEGLSAETAIAIRARLAGVAGLRVEGSAQRNYVADPTLAHLLGYVSVIPEEDAEELAALGYPLDSRIGRTGVESVYEEALRGDPGRRLVLADPRGREVEPLATSAAEAGADVVLSIDLRLQRATAAALAEGMDAGIAVVRRDTGQDRPDPIQLGAAVVMDIHTGELRASVSLPGYDPNTLIEGDDDAIAALLSDPARPLIDRTYMEVRSPGSIYKPLVALAALEEGIATADTRIYSSGAILVPDQYTPGVFYTFRDWAAHGLLDMKAALARSSDVYFYLLVGGYHGPQQEDFEGMGAATLAVWSHAMGFGRATGLDLPGEATGLVPDPGWKERVIGEPWLLGDSYPFSIGQGYLTVTPLQMAVMTAALANGGDLLRPRVVHGFRENGSVTPIARETTGQVDASEAHFEIVRQGMLQASQPGGTAATGVPAGMRTGGKTGTAEFGQPYPDGEFDTHGWYIAFAPYDDPQIAVAVYLEYGVGSTHAGPVARKILEAYFTPDTVARQSAHPHPEAR
ncbi:MAG: penicillin-binding protein 2 [Chloroflexi bacterium]|nr:penicillin-binding protein 2 [Chloroflexota bacterium]MQC17177.1 penicillin-binding protein 2 [Chloroflexota bacterium]